MAKSNASKGAKKISPTGSINVASANFFGVPKDVREASKRQYKAGSPGAEPYTQKDRETIMNYYKKKNKKGKA